MDKQNFMAMNLSNQEVVKKPGECVAIPFAPAELLASEPVATGLSVTIVLSLCLFADQMHQHSSSSSASATGSF